jgi:hypothetical protein
VFTERKRQEAPEGLDMILREFRLTVQELTKARARPLRVVA